MLDAFAYCNAIFATLWWDTPASSQGHGHGGSKVKNTSCAGRLIVVGSKPDVRAAIPTRHKTKEHSNNGAFRY